MNGKYTVTPVARTSRVNKGETVEIEVYIQGYGAVERNKLQFVHSQSDFIDPTDPGKLVWSVDVEEDNDNIVPVPGKRGLETFAIDEWATMTILHDGYFADLADANPTEGGELGIEQSEGHLLPIVAEASHDGHPPLLLKLNTDTDARAGDYDIPVVFTYKSDGELRQAKESVSIHVNTWVEQYRVHLEIAGLVGIVITFLILVANVV